MRSAMRTLEKRCEMSTAVLPSRQLLEALEHLELGARVERGGRLVEDQHLRIAHVGAGDGDLLPLAAGEVDAGLEAAADQLVVALRQPGDHLVGQARRRRPRMRARSSRASMRPTPMFSPAVRW